jgi:hypothetical protein
MEPVYFTDKSTMINQDNNNDRALEIQTSKYDIVSAAWGMVVYMIPSNYSENIEENKNIHFNHHKSEILKIIYQLCVTHLRIKPEDIMNILVGHEHGTTNHKCHMQVCIFLNKKIHKKISPGEIKYQDRTYLYMAQKCKNPQALYQYCKKEGDHISMNDKYSRVKTGNEENKFSIPKLIVENQGKEKDEIMELCFQTNPEYTMNKLIQIEKYFKNYHNTNTTEFKWTIPEHILNSNHLPHKKIVFHIKKYFIPEFSEKDRRKALIILSPPNFGKTCFAKSLVSHSDFYIYYRSGMTSSALKNKKTAKLLIIDDIKYPKDEQIEEYKGLFSSQEITVRGPWINESLPGLPCILLTNNYALCSLFLNHPEFKGRFNIVCLGQDKEDYLGPEGTYKSNFSENIFEEMHLDTLFNYKHNEAKKKFEVKKYGQADDKNLQMIMEKDQKISILTKEAKIKNKKIQNLEKELEHYQKYQLRNSINNFKDFEMKFEEEVENYNTNDLFLLDNFK